MSDVSSMEDGIVITLRAQDTRTAVARRVIQHMRGQLESLERLLLEDESESAMQDLSRMVEAQQRDGFAAPAVRSAAEGRIVEGVFDGQNMVAEDGTQYLVPPNYASKSKLVEGDFMRLVITDAGRFIFKQRGPIERQRSMGTVIYNDQTDEWFVAAEGTKYKVLTASITFHRAQPNDEAVVLVPRDNPSRWAALENVIKRDLSAMGI